jgi:hypothetical protein
MDMQTCVKNYIGCTNGGDQNDCYECGFGRQLDGNTCKGVINCDTYSEKCTKCSEGYTLKNNICVDQSPGCAKVRPQDGLCESCKPGYFYSGYRCFEDKYKNDRCYILTNNTYCMYCKTGYNPLDGKCLLPS